MSRFNTIAADISAGHGVHRPIFEPGAIGIHPPPSGLNPLSPLGMGSIARFAMPSPTGVAA